MSHAGKKDKGQKEQKKKSKHTLKENRNTLSSPVKSKPLIKNGQGSLYQIEIHSKKASSIKECP
jgi:hypothetical protein